MSKWGWAARIGGWAAAPWTGGASIPIGEGIYRSLDDEGKPSGQPGKDGFDWSDLLLPGAAAAGGFAAGRAGGGGGKSPTETPFLNELTRSSEANRAQGQAFSNQSAEALQPALQYLKSLTSADPAALMDATRQDRGRVLDQYDTARRAITQFGPRGGGTTSALAESRFAQAESLADITSTARRDAVGQLAQLGPQLAYLGISSNQLASQDLNSIIDAIMTREGLNVQQRGQNMQMWGDIANVAGQLVGIWLGRDKEKAA